MTISLRLRNALRDNWFLALGLAVQVAAFLLSGDTWISFLCGTFGVFAVVWCSRKRVISYIPSFLQMATYIVISYRARLYGEVASNAFYFITMIAGLFMWMRGSVDGVVKPNHLGRRAEWHLIGIMVFLVFAGYLVLSSTDDSQPFMDSLTTVPAFIAQLLMIFKYREQWMLWCIIDVASIYMWFVAGSWCMVMQYAFWTANCFYGYRLWSDGRE